MIFTPLGQRIVVRFARKAIWMPTARSKIFRIPEHTFYSSEEMLRIFRLYDDYHLQMNSVSHLLKHEYYIPATQSGGLPKEFLAQEEELDEELNKENDVINAKIAHEKNEYFTELNKNLRDQVLRRKEEIEGKLLEDAEKVDNVIKELDCNSFITPENIDSMIEKAIDNPVNYEFCIDGSGRKYGPGANIKRDSRS